MSAPSERHPHPLADYLATSGESRSAFAARAGTTTQMIAGVIAGACATDLASARRMVAASGGAVGLVDVLAPGAREIVEGCFGGPRINAALLAAVLEVVSPNVFSRDSGDAAFAADVVADIYDAIGAVTALSRPDRLAEALRPALQENFSRRADLGDPDETARQAARLYFAAESRLLA